MLKILIVDDDPIQCKLLINYLSKTSENVKIYNMAFTGKEALKIIEQNEINIILLDLNLPDISGIDIIKYIEQKKMEKYYNSIIIISGEKELVSKVNCSSYIYHSLYKPTNYEEIKTLISNIEIENNIKNKIKMELNKLYYNPSYNGTKYIFEAIYESYLRKNLDCNNLKNSIYPILAIKHNTNINNIHSNIKQATKSMFYDCPENILNAYFNFDKAKKPKEKLVITTILNKIERSNL